MQNFVPFVFRDAVQFVYENEMSKVETWNFESCLCGIGKENMWNYISNRCYISCELFHSFQNSYVPNLNQMMWIFWHFSGKGSTPTINIILTWRCHKALSDKKCNSRGGFSLVWWWKLLYFPFLRINCKHTCVCYVFILLYVY